jgi:hypothetical protein
VFTTGDCKKLDKYGFFRLHLNQFQTVETITCLAKFVSLSSSSCHCCSNSSPESTVLVLRFRSFSLWIRRVEDSENHPISSPVLSFVPHLQELNVHNLICLWGKHEILLNHLVLRYDMNMIPDFFDYFNQPWACAIYHKHFPAVLDEIHDLLSNAQTNEGTKLIDEVRNMLETNGWNPVRPVLLVSFVLGV